MTNYARSSVYNGMQRNTKEVGLGFVTDTLYLDVYFLVNFAMDILLLGMVKRLLKLPGERRRLVLAGGCGALWACALVCLPVFPGWLEAGITWVLGGGLMVFLAFGRMGFPEFGKTVCTLWLASAAAGGVLTALGDHVRTGWYIAGGMIPARFSAISLLCWMAGIYFGICACIAFVRERVRERDHLYEVTLSYRGKKKTVTAFYDTGNQLYEPYGHEPVHIITYDACRQLCEPVSQVIYIPFRAVGTASGMIPGIRVDEMEVAQGGKMVRRYERPWLAVSKEPLSASHRYEMLLHGDWANRENI